MPRAGKVDEMTLKRIIRLAKHKPTISAPEIARQIQNIVSDRAVRYQLNKAGYFSIETDKGPSWKLKVEEPAQS
jgi:hypothetical protein